MCNLNIYWRVRFFGGDYEFFLLIFKSLLNRKPGRNRRNVHFINYWVIFFSFFKIEGIPDLLTEVLIETLVFMIWKK